MSDFPISGLRSVEMLVPDIEAALAFYTGVWGLSLAARDDGAVWLRASGADPYALRLEQGATAMRSITLRADPATDLAALRDRAIAAGGAAGQIVILADFGGGTGCAVRDPAGRLWRLVQHDAALDPVPARSVPDRLAHVNINCTDINRDRKFLEDAFGFTMTDRSAKMAFMRTNDDHHSIVLAEDQVDTLNHVAYNHPTWEGVMMASGRMCDAQFPIGWGPGRHGPGDNVFAYFLDPFGIVVEHTAEVLQVDDNYRVGTPADWVWPKGRTDQWGIAPPKTEACKAAQLAVPFEQNSKELTHA